MPITVQVNPVLSDAAVQQIREIVRDEIAKAEARARPHGKVFDGEYHPCSCGDATAMHEIASPGEVTQ